jgi:lipopolysaccharide biosynthesis glycosyltransferase
MGFVVDGIASMALESQFFLSLGKAPEAPAFNSGTMLFNLPEWRRQSCSTRIFAFCREHSAQLMTADQTALNALFADDCFHLDPRYNVKVRGTTDPGKIPVNGVFHFVGSPKPWDIGGRRLLPHAESWFDDLHKTVVPFHKRVSWLNYASWSRLPKILGGYGRIARKKLFKR